MTLVLVPETFPLVRSLWMPMSVATLREARRALGLRECERKENPETCVDYWPRGCKNEFVARTVGKWAKGLQVDAVVWTNLRPKFNGAENEIPTAEQVVTYLRDLQSQKREKEAEDYVRRTPRQIDTEYRRKINVELGWTCTEAI